MTWCFEQPEVKTKTKIIIIDIFVRIIITD